MPTAERPLRLAEFDQLFAQHLREIDRDREEVRMRLVGDDQLRGRVVDLTERESGCCSFFGFAVDGTDSDVFLTITVPPARYEFLTSLAARAAELSA